MTSEFDIRSLHQALEKFLKSRGVDVYVVRGYQEGWEEYGHCSTCAGRDYTVYIYYDDWDDIPHTYTYIGDLAYLIRELTDD